VVGVANLLGIVSYVPNPGGADLAHPPCFAKQLQLVNLGKLFSSQASTD